ARRPADGSIVHRQLDRLRRKLARKGDAPTHPDLAPARRRTSGGGPRGAGRDGPRPLLNRWWVLAPLFLLTLGLLVWGRWPRGPEALFARGATRMESPTPDDWSRAWDNYLGPLQNRFPAFKPEEVAALRRKLDEHDAGRQAERAADRSGPMTEA